MNSDQLEHRKGLIAISTTFDHVIVAKMITRLVDEIGQEFIEAHRQLEKDEVALHPPEVRK